MGSPKTSFAIVQAIMCTGLLLAGASCSNPPPSSPPPVPTVAAPVSTFDGVYAGDMDKVIGGNSEICASASHKTLNVTGGHAAMVGEPDTRVGTVSADGTLTMTGYVATPPRSANATLTGKFANNGFKGTSSISVVNCEYEWNLTRQ